MRPGGAYERPLEGRPDARQHWDVNVSAPEVVAAGRGPLRRVRRKRLVATALVGAAAALAATALAARLDTPVRSGPKDAAPIIAGPVIIAEDEVFGAKGLPPFALVLERPAPADLVGRSKRQRLTALRARANTKDLSVRVQLGAAEQAAGNQDRALLIFQDVVATKPDNLAGQIGVAFAKASGGGAAAGEAALILQRLAEEHPSDQLVAFNRGWLAAYRRDATTALLAWRQALEIDPATNLGATARGLIQRVRSKP